MKIHKWLFKTWCWLDIISKNVFLYVSQCYKQS